jgi:hypothetical protein
VFLTACVGYPEGMRRFRLAAFVPALALLVPAASPPPRFYVATITDTECGPSHARMLATGNMGKTDAECTRTCVKRGASYGAIAIVDGKPRFVQLDDQERPAPYAGMKVRIWGKLDGDTIFVDHIEAMR